MSVWLVLEDDDNLRATLVDVLEDLDYSILAAANPDDAIQLAGDASPDGVLADVRMAGPIDGLGVLERLKHGKPDLRCIVMTGYADEGAPLRALKIRVDDYLYKPFEVSDLVLALRRVEQSHSQHHWFQRLLRRITGRPEVQALRNQLEDSREQALKLFYVAIRSGHLYAETALERWDAWEDLELLYFKQAVDASALQQTLERYQQWTQSVSQRVAQDAFVSASGRSAERVARNDFKRLFERIRSGAVSAAELTPAACLRHLPPNLRESDQECEALWTKLWGP